MSYSRKDYMTDKCTHQQYYNQFVNNYVLASVRAKYTPAELVALLDADEHLNNINMSRIDTWTRGAASYLAGVNYRLNGCRSWSPSMGCSTFKAACKQVANEVTK